MAPAKTARLRSAAAPAGSTSSAFHGPQNLIVQALGIGMVGLTAWLTLPPVLVTAWIVASGMATFVEDRLLERVARAPATSQLSARLAAVMRVVVTTLFAVAAFVLIMKGQPGDRLFAFAIVSAALVHVLMRHYRSPAILAASLIPWVAGCATVPTMLPSMANRMM